MGIRENKIESYLVQEIKKRSGLCYKWISPGCAGVPDRIVIIKGIVYFVEIKTPDGKISSQQFREQTRLLEAGMPVYTLFCKENIDDFLALIRA